MKKILTLILMSLMFVGLGSAATMTLENKDLNWDVIEDSTFGELTYNQVGSEFEYSVTAEGLLASTSYSLIYYADPWPGNNPGALIGVGTTDENGDLTMTGSSELGMNLPNEDDENGEAKIWLVTSSDYGTGDFNAETTWNPSNYLFEYDTITYTDIDELCVQFDNPVEGSFVGADEVNAGWEYVEECGSTSYDIQYKEGSCDGQAGWSNPLATIGTITDEYSWDISDLDDGEYCLKLSSDGDNAGFSGVFTIDNTAPVALFTANNPQFVYETVEFDASASTDDGSGIVEYAWDFDDGETGTGVETTHEYAEAGEYEVTLVVTDAAGNPSEPAIVEIVIEDIEPEEETYAYETGIVGTDAPELNEEFDTGLTDVECGIVPGANGIDGVTIGSDGTSCTIDSSSVPYDERGVHNLVIRAYSEEDGIKYYSVEISVYSWWIVVEEGWNLVSIPMMPESTDIDDVLGGIQENIAEDYSIFQYDATYGSSGKWYKAKPTSTWTGTLDDIVPGYGYWIKMDAEDVLKGIGSITPEVGGALLSVTVENGWNLIGQYGLANLKVASALTSLRIGNTRYYDAVVTDKTKGDDPAMNKYEGYWMTVKFLPDETTEYTPSQKAIDRTITVL